MMTGKKQLDWGRIKQDVARREAALHDGAGSDAAKLEEVLRRRAERLAHRQQRDLELAPTCSMLTFCLAGERYGIELARVAHVFAHQRCFPVPGAPEHLLGVTNLRGEVCSVIDLRRVLKLSVASELPGCLILVRVETNEITFWVEAVESIVHIDRVQLAKAQEAGEATRGPFIRTVTDQSLIVLDIDALIKAIVPQIASHRNIPDASPTASEIQNQSSRHFLRPAGRN